MRSRGPGKYDRTRSARERRADQRAALLAAAAEVFAARGFAGASVAQIVARCGMSRRTFYEHFDDLRAVLLELHDESAKLAYRYVESRVESERDPLARARVGIEAFLQALAANGELARVIFREVRAAGPRYEARRQAELARYVALTQRALRAAHRAGQIRRAPDELTIYALIAGVEAVGMRFVESGEEEKAPAAAPALAELIVRAFK